MILMTNSMILSAPNAGLNQRVKGLFQAWFVMAAVHSKNHGVEVYHTFWL